MDILVAVVYTMLAIYVYAPCRRQETKYGTGITAGIASCAFKLDQSASYKRKSVQNPLPHKSGPIEFPPPFYL